MVKRIIYVAFVSVGFLTTACNRDLDPEVELSLTRDQVMLTYNNTLARAVSVYTYLPNGLDELGGGAMLASASDEAEHTLETNSVQWFNLGVWNAVSNPDGAWGRCFDAIRAANLFLENSDEVNLDNFRLDPSESAQNSYKTFSANIERWKYEVRFLRAFYYFELVKRYGGVPILTRTYTIGDDYGDVERAALRDCFDFIVAECDAVAAVLPAVYGDGDLGRATKGAALALKSRVLLYAASDLYNDPAWSGGYANPELISDASGDRAAKWDAAAKAAKAVLDLSEARYSLATDYQGLFRTFNNPEIIFTRRLGNNNSFETANYPIGYDRGNSGTTPSQNLVDAYEMADGTAFSWSNPAHAADPYAGRDPRLGYSILTNNVQFKGRALESWTGGRDGRGVANATKTGYYINKWVDPNLDLLLNQSSIHSFVLMRLAETYLNYAEAMNEAWGPESDNGYGMTALAAVNAVRARQGVGMPAIPSGLTKEQLRERIRNERRVELAFEGHRVWDVRRWMIAPETLGAPLRGVAITRSGTAFSYSVIEVEKRAFNPAMYFYPIPQTDLNISGWPQNPLW